MLHAILCKLARFLPVYAAVVYVARAGNVLSVSRKGTGQVAAPGGKREPHETSEEAARRELREETGLGALSLVQVYRGFHGLRVIEAFVATVDDGAEAVALEPGTRVAWVPPRSLARAYAPRLHRRALRAAGFDV